MADHDVTREQVCKARQVADFAFDTFDRTENPGTHPGDAWVDAFAEALGLTLAAGPVKNSPDTSTDAQPTAVATGQLDEPVQAGAKAAWIAKVVSEGSDPEWAENAWEDMGGSEPTDERSLTEYIFRKGLIEALAKLNVEVRR